MADDKLSKLKQYLTPDSPVPPFGEESGSRNLSNDRSNIFETDINPQSATLLKNRLQKFNRGPFSDSFRFKIKTIITVTIIGAILLFTLQIWQTSRSVIPQARQDTSRVAQTLITLLGRIRSKDDLDILLKEFQTSITELQSSLEGLDGLLWPFFSSGNLAQEAAQLTQDWVNASRNLLQFQLDNQGFTSDLPRNFTDYLEIFFDDLSGLLYRSQALLDTIHFYGNLTAVTGRPELKSLRETILLADGVLNVGQELYRHRAAILTFLGNDNVHKILIFNQNVGESRPNGGFIGSYISLNINQGRVDIGQSQSIYYADNSKNQPMLAFPAAWYYDYQYDLLDEHGLRNLNYFPCFETTARMLEREFAKVDNGQSADTVIFLTPNLIRALFSDTTELKVNSRLATNEQGSNAPNLPYVLTKNNFYDVVERLTAIEYEDQSNPKAALSPILLAILNNLSSILGSQEPIALASSVLNLGHTRDIQLWSKNTRLEAFWDDFSVGGNQACQRRVGHSEISNPASLAFLQANISADKRDILAKHQFQFQQLQSTRLQVDYTRTYANLNTLQRQFNAANGLTFVGFQLPTGAKNAIITSTQSLKLPFLRPLYTVGLKEKYLKDYYAPPEIETVINTYQDLDEDSFNYQQPDGSTVIGMYINEQEQIKVRLQFEVDSPIIGFYPNAGSVSNTITTSDNLNLINTLDFTGQTRNMTVSAGEAVIIFPNRGGISNYLNCAWFQCSNKINGESI